jgi:hypothetical protein
MNARTVGFTAVALAAAAVAVAGCSARPGTDAQQPSGPTWSTQATSPSPTGSRLVLPPVSPITPSPGRVGTPSTVPPAPPAPDTSSATFADPVVVARAWMTQWCAMDYREPINHNVERASVFATSAGKAADLAAGDSPATYRSVVEQKLTNRCDRIIAEVSPEAPHGPNQVYVVLTADRTQLAADQPFQVLPVITTRSVIRQADGRWLVDVHVEAG